MKYFFLLLGIVLVFFYPIFSGKIPFPGDLLVSTYEPYRAYPILNYPPAGVPSKAQGADVVRHMFPWKYFSVKSMKKCEIPFWNPHNFSGNPLMGNFQSGVFYPLNFIFFILPFLTAWSLYILLIPLLSSFFMYLFLMELKLSRLASIFGAITFAFSSYMTVWLEWGNIGHTLLWLPLALLLTEKLTKSFRSKYLVLLVLTLFSSLLAGYIQAYFYITITILIYFLAKNFSQKNTKKTLIFLFSLGAPVALSLFQILPTIDLFTESSRFNYSLPQIQELLNPWWYLVTTLVPNFFGNPAASNHWFSGTYIERVSYIGLIPFVLFLYALLNYRKKIEIKIFGAIALVSLFLATDLFFSKYFFTIPFPVISTTVPTRILSLFQFGAVVLAAIGFDYLRSRKNFKYLGFSVLFVLLILTVSWIFTFLAKGNIDPAKLEVTKRNLFIPTIIFLSFFVLVYLWLRYKWKLILLLILAITVIDLFYFFHKITPFSPKEFVYPETPVIKYLKNNAGINRFWGFGSGYIEGNFQTFDNTFSPDGVDPIHIRRYTRLLESARSGRIAAELPRPDAKVPQGFGKEDLRNNLYRQRLLNLLGVKYVLHKTDSKKADLETFPELIYKLIYSDGHYQIYENKEVLPRVFLAGDYVVVTDKQDIVDHLFNPNLDLKKTLVLEEKIPSIKFSEDDESKAEIVNYGNNKVQIQTSARSNMLLFLSDTYFERWNAEVDGKPAKIYRADYAFRAVPVPAGNHNVTFIYKSLAFENGLLISSGFLALLLIGLFYLKKHEKI